MKEEAVEQQGAPVPTEAASGDLDAFFGESNDFIIIQN